MSLINIQDYEITNNGKWDMNGAVLRLGIDRLKQKRLVTEEENENVIDVFELMIELHKITKEKEKRCGNKNNPKGN